jgi:acyl-CoA reductase-like NAD-dependent aldehyde dehydrogenase
MEKKDCFIDGKWLPTEESLPVRSPWSGEVAGEVSLAGPQEWEQAIVAAEQAALVLKKMVQPGAAPTSRGHGRRRQSPAG